MRKKLYIGIFLSLTALYIILTAVLPTDPAVLQRYQLNQGSAHMLGLTIAIPIVLIWLFALYGFTKFYDYAHIIKESPEGPGFQRLVYGLMTLVLSLPIVASVSSIFTYVGYRNPDLVPKLTITKNYLGLFFAVAAFLLIADGAEKLVRTLRSKTLHLTIPRFGLGACIVLSCFYAWLVTTRSTDSGDTYYLPNLLIITTLAIPYLFIWCRGALAAYHLYLYKDRVRGKIYREALGSLALGIGAVILLSISLQLLVTTSAKLTKLNLSPLLSFIYVLVAMTAVGYGLIARGAKKLKQIEEV
ncbi:MAG TPA: hypothetical protein VM124_02055 [Candidatus Limnocylindrales bacterium]|nr:hypothetical protein [Candidatus Limnocylindrales bacterium]